MQYEGTVYRPPSEADSLIIQVTIGCSHNRCTFCNMFKDKQFRLRSISSIISDLEACSKHYQDVERIFLADGDALIMPTARLVEILRKCRELYPKCKRIGIYATPGAVLRKTPAELTVLQQEGLAIAYLGVESGSDKILQFVTKGATKAEIIEAGQKIKATNIKLSITLISGLGGKDYWQEHAIESGKIVDQLQPDYLGLLTLLLEPGTQLYEQEAQGSFKALSPLEILSETKLMLENINTVNGCVFRSNHVSNYLALAGNLIEDKPKLINSIDHILSHPEQLPNKPYRQL